MATLPENVHLPEKVNIKLKKVDSGHLVGICTEVKHHEKSAPVAPRGLERPATTQPTCCPRYPPGSTLLECRLEGDQPVAHVVQIPADGDTATQKMCLLVETKSPSGPYSRVISRPIEYPQDPNQVKSSQNDGCNGPAQYQMAYRLESRECDGGPVAMITKVPVDETTNVIMTLETTKGDERPDGPSSRIHYGPAIGETLKASSCAENSRNLPATMIECTSTAKRASARITRCLKNGTNRAKNDLENSADCSSHKSRVPSTSCLEHRVAETCVDENGPKAYVSHLPQDIERSRDCKKAKSTRDRQSTVPHQQPKRKRSETSRTSCSPPRCLTICPASSKAMRPPERRNGLDPEDNLPISLFRRIPRKQVCPCSPLKGEHRSGSSSPERGQRARRESSDTKFFECVLLPCSLTKKLQRESEKSAKDCTEPKLPTKMKTYNVEIRKEDCTKPKTMPKEDCTKPKTIPKEDSCRDRHGSKARRKSVEDCSKDFVPEIPSQELLTRFRDYFSPHQLQRYEVCRSRRNGLQDQCQLSIPRAVIELKKKEMLARDSPEKSERAGLAQPIILICTDPKPDCEESSKKHIESICA